MVCKEKERGEKHGMIKEKSNQSCFDYSLESYSKGEMSRIRDSSIRFRILRF